MCEEQRNHEQQRDGGVDLTDARAASHYCELSNTSFVQMLQPCSQL